MQVPETPPQLDSGAQFKLYMELQSRLVQAQAALPADDYQHWDKLKFQKAPANLTPEEWWTVVKYRRQAGWRLLPVRDKTGRPFVFGLTDLLLERLHKIDQQMAGIIALPEKVTNPQTREHYVMRSLIDEALHSSQIEGAVATRKAAKEMIRAGRKPRNKSEQMVLNNFLAMERIKDLHQQKLTPQVVRDLHRILTKQTLPDPADCGMLRTSDDIQVVDEATGDVMHAPPPSVELPSRLQAMCDFANGETPKFFVHPVIRAITLHFWLAYDHPFVDGNGRCARALFYWSMLRAGYWLLEFLSISTAVYKSRQQYYRAFLYAETDDNDLTYFILYHVEAISRAEEDLRRNLSKKARELQELNALLRSSVQFNHRQRELLQHALQHSEALYTIEEHRGAHNVVYQTARTDLLELAEKGLLTKRRVKNAWVFSPQRGLERELKSIR